MVSRGMRSIQEFLNEKCDLIPLESKKIESGEVYKKTIFKNSNTEISFLWVGPRARIKEHKHLEDSELYRDVDDGFVEICNKGKTHKVYNIDDNNWLLILSIKSKDEIRPEF